MPGAESRKTYSLFICLTKLSMEEQRLKIEVAKAQIEGQLDLGEQEVLKESYKELNKTYFTPSYFDSLPDWTKPIIAIMFAVLDFIRGVIRPALTIFIIGLVFWLGYSTYQANPKAFVASASIIVEVILYLTVTVITWWFSDRKIEKYLIQKLK